MPTTTTYRKGDIGVRISVRVTEGGSAKDISSATTKQIKIQGPTGKQKTYAATFRTDGTDGILDIVTTAATDLDELGVWTRRAYLVLASGFTGHTEKGTFTVEATEG